MLISQENFSFTKIPVSKASDTQSKIDYTQQTPINVQQAWNKILLHHDGLKAQNLNTKAMEKMRLAARLSYLPQIDLNAFYLHMGDRIQLDLTAHNKNEVNLAQQQICNSSPPLPQLCSLITTLNTPITLMNRNIIVGALNILYPIYTGGTRFYGNKLAEIALKDSYQALRLKELATFEELVEIYYSVVLAKESLEVLQATQEGALKHYQNSMKLHKLGQIADLELLGSQVAYDKARNNTLAAQNVFDVTQLALDSILQSQNVLPTSVLQISPTMKLKEINYYVDITLQSYPALQIARNKITSATQQHKLEFGKFMPQIGAFASFVVTDNQSKLEQMMPNWYLGIAAKWSIVSPQGRFQKFQATKIMQLQASALESQAVKDMELLVKKTYKQLVFYQQEHENLHSSVALAKENLRLQEKAYMQGIATNDQVVDARNALSLAIMEQQAVAYKTIVTYAKLQALSGNIEEFFKVQQ
ncbi:TolC family protein [Helicobacter didelphidarum]|uniref:TolC family protein n=1 Tax=Helicobacter didelphidarum TaxID=2040648 RepID=A0A3D8IM16_9HELI|nr:TolC family protein [Helicobacter didelphidarum]RDU66269.1 TolC family protein [Helicobacter didelphidarum]